MPTLALVKGKTSQHIESIGTQAHSTGLPHKNGQRKKKWRLSSNLKRATCLHCVLSHLPFRCLRSTLPSQKYEAVLSTIHSSEHLELALNILSASVRPLKMEWRFLIVWFFFFHTSAVQKWIYSSCTWSVVCSDSVYTLPFLIMCAELTHFSVEKSLTVFRHELVFFLFSPLSSFFLVSVWQF